MSNNWIYEAGITSIPTKNKLCWVKVKIWNWWSSLRHLTVKKMNPKEAEIRVRMMSGADNFDANELTASVIKRRAEWAKIQDGEL